MITIIQAQSVIQKMNKKSKMGKIMKKVIILTGILAVLLCFESCMLGLIPVIGGTTVKNTSSAVKGGATGIGTQHQSSEDLVVRRTPSNNDGGRYVDEEGNSYRYPPFSVFLKKYIEEQIEEWQKRGEFEKTDEWQERVNEETREQKIAELTDNAVSAYVEWLELSLGDIWGKKPLPGKLILGQYDADNEIYIVTSENFGDIPVFVPIDEASDFKHSWNSDPYVDNYANYYVRSRVTYFIKNNQPALAKVIFCEKYTYRNSDAPLDAAK